MKRRSVTEGSEWRWWLLCAGVFLLAALALTWPLALHLKTRVLWGSEASATVSQFNMWSLWWNFDRLAHGYRGYWNAPIFAPVEGAFAFSETHLLTALLAAPVWLATRNLTLAYNSVLLLSVALNGGAVCVLLGGLKLRREVALAGGLLVQLLPFVWQESGVLQLAPVWGIVLSLHFALRFAQSGRLRDALALGLSFAATYHTSGYYGLMLSLLLLVFVPLMADRRLLRWQTAAALLAGASVGAILVAPIALKQAAILDSYHLARSSQTILNNSAALVDYGRLPRMTLGYRLWGRWAEPDGAQRLYPGTGVLALAAVCAAAGWRNAHLRRVVLVCVVCAALAFALSFGPQLAPYRLLSRVYLGMDQLRSPFRFAVFAQLFVAILAAFGVEALLSRARTRVGLGAVAALLLLTVCELLPVPARLLEVPEQAGRPWVTWLAEQPPGTRIAHAPFVGGTATRDYEQTTTWMLAQTIHGQAMVNGYSGYSPPLHRTLKSAMAAFPDENSLRRLRQAGVDYVLVDAAWLADDQRVALEAWQSCLSAVFESPEVTIYSLSGPEGGCP